jgi:hypothetical protein
MRGVRRLPARRITTALRRFPTKAVGAFSTGEGRAFAVRRLSAFARSVLAILYRGHTKTVLKTILEGAVIKAA